MAARPPGSQNYYLAIAASGLCFYRIAFGAPQLSGKQSNGTGPNAIREHSTLHGEPARPPVIRVNQ